MSFVPFAFVVTVSVLCHVKCENGTLAEMNERAAVVHGYNAPNRPFYVELRIWVSGGYATCGGTIISKHHVLSAAHCFADGYKSIEVLVGNFADPHSKKTSISARVKYHSGYTGSPKYYNDVAVLRLSKGVSSSRALPMCKKSYSDYTIAVCGMGKTSGYYHDSMPSRLQETKLQEYSSCSNSPYFNKKYQVCLGPIKGYSYSDSCGGDSGGPIYPLSHASDHHPKCVYGIVSYGSKNCDGEGVYTRVSAYYHWIKDHY